MAQRLNGSGAVLSSDLYDGFGSRTSTGGSDVFGFEAQAGYYTDSETGLVLCTHRYYDPQAGRFLTRDLMGYEGGINLYGYTGNDDDLVKAPRKDTLWPICLPPLPAESPALTWAS